MKKTFRYVAILSALPLATPVLASPTASQAGVATTQATQDGDEVAAADVIGLEAISIAPNSTHKVAVTYTKASAVSSMTMVLNLPQGLTATKIERNASRIDRSEFGLSMDKIAGSNSWVIMLTGNAGEAIYGDEGDLFYVTIEAADFFGGTATLSDIKLSTLDAKPIGLDDVQAQFSACDAGTFSFGAETLNVAHDEWTRVAISLDNAIEINGLQAVLTLPEGIEIQMRGSNNSKINFEYGDRLPEDVSIQSNKLADGSLKIVVSGTEGNSFGTEGEILAFYVKGQPGDDAAITFDNVYVSVLSGKDVPNTGTSVRVVPDPAAINRTVWGIIQEDLALVTAAADEYEAVMANLMYASRNEEYNTVAGDARAWVEETMALYQARFEAGELTAEDDVKDDVQDQLAAIDITAAAQYDAQRYSAAAYNYWYGNEDGIEGSKDGIVAGLSLLSEELAAEVKASIDEIEEAIGALKDEVENYASYAQDIHASIIAAHDEVIDKITTLVDEMGPYANDAAWARIQASIEQVRTAAEEYAAGIGNLMYASRNEEYSSLPDEALLWVEETSAEYQARHEAGELTAEDGVKGDVVEWLQRLDINAAALYDASVYYNAAYSYWNGGEDIEGQKVAVEAGKESLPEEALAGLEDIIANIETGLAAMASAVEGYSAYSEEAHAAVIAMHDEIVALVASAVELVESNKVIQGDVNNDGVVNTQDYTRVLRFLLEQAVPTEEETAIADFNGNNRIDNGDLTAIVGIILKNANTASHVKARTVALGNDAITVNAEKRGEITRYAIDINAAASYASAMLDITLASGATIVGTSMGNAASGMTLYSSTVGNGAQRMLLASAIGAQLQPQGTLLYIDVRGTASISIDGIGLSDYNGNLYHVDGTATAVTGIAAQDNVEVYSITGMKTNAMNRGLNIVKGANGAATKVFKK